MKKIVINDYGLTDDDIDIKVVRVKGFIINSDGQILLAHNNNTYQFPGGHIEDNEDMGACLIREIKEETGIRIDYLDEPFLCISTYDNDYFGSGKKVLNSIYYYRVLTDAEPNFKETHYDELELATDFNLFYIPFNTLESFLNKCMTEGTIDKKIGIEMLHAVEVYNTIY